VDKIESKFLQAARG